MRSAVSIRSAEGEGTIVLQLRREAQDARMEIVCDKKADCLPTHYRIGTYINGKWVTWTDESCDWRQTDGVWFPVHQTTEGYVGAKFTAVKFLDLTIRNLRANDKADVADSALDPALLFQYLSALIPSASASDTKWEIRASFDRQGRATRPFIDLRVSFRGAFLKAFRPDRSVECRNLVARSQTFGDLLTIE